MANDRDPKGKSAVSESAEAAEEHDEAAKADVDGETVNTPQADSPTSQIGSEEGEASEGTKDAEVDSRKGTPPRQLGHEEQLRQYRWCKCLCDPALFDGQDRYFLHMDTQESKWDEPTEPYWLWDASTQTIDPTGLQYPNNKAPETSDEPDPNYFGYNPKIHGNYDPNAPYAQYHNKMRKVETHGDEEATAAIPAAPGTYETSSAFNRFTGNFQTAEQAPDRHNDHNKAGRQMGVYFDVDSAANAHDGRSLKQERRNERLSGKQIRELAEKRRAKKEKKRMEFYKS